MAVCLYMSIRLYVPTLRLCSWTFFSNHVAPSPASCFSSSFPSPFLSIHPTILHSLSFFLSLSLSVCVSLCPPSSFPALPKALQLLTPSFPLLPPSPSLPVFLTSPLFFFPYVPTLWFCSWAFFSGSVAFSSASCFSLTSTSSSHLWNMSKFSSYDDHCFWLLSNLRWISVTSSHITSHCSRTDLEDRV